MGHFGLNDAQVAASREKYGDNRMTEQKKRSFWSKLGENFKDPMVKILLVALAINILFTLLGQAEWYEPVGIAVAILLATLVSTFSEYKNENAFQQLQQEASRILCKVYRNGSVSEMAIDELVVGDCVLLQSGDKVPADGVLLTGEVKVDQAALNGETKEADKRPMPDAYIEQNVGMDFLNPYLLFRGAVVCSGDAVLCVTMVGDKTVYGQIASELQQEDERDSPLKVKLRHLAHTISRFGYIGGVAIALAFLLQRIVIHNGFDFTQIAAYCANWMGILNDVVQAVVLAVIIIVMAVPEGLPLMIAIVSALNMRKMLKDNVLVRKITGIETAGSLNILFSDKTGTITKGKLEAVTFLGGDGHAYRSYGEVVGELGRLLSLSVYHNTSAVLTGPETERRVVGGNATERAILGFAECKGHSLDVAKIHAIPFDSKNKYSAACVQGEYDLTLIKGAPEKILSQCKYYYDENGTKQPFDCAQQLDAQIAALAERAVRVLALATSEGPLQDEVLPQGQWTLVGVIGIRDEVRPESAAALKEARAAGIQVVMITGDRADTAVAIAKDAGLYQGGDDLVLTSDQLGAMSDDEVKSKLVRMRVIARALPGDKSRLVRLAQEMGLVVGMTGDGVNDSPALKKADVGFAMGGGTEVAKEAGDIVVMDDNFSSIAQAILYGRTIFSSIRKFIVFQLTVNVAAVLISFAAPLLGIENPLSITQILWVNLVMDTLAALAFGGEPALRRYMQQKPKKRTERIVSRPMWGQIFAGSIWIFFLSLFFLLSATVAGVFRPDPQNRYLLTGYFAFFIFAAVFNAFNARTERFNLFDSIGQNTGFFKVIGLIVAVQVFMTYLGGAVLRCFGLNLHEWLLVLVLAVTVIPVDLLRKAVLHRRARKEHR